MGRSIPQGHENKTSRPSASSVINRTRLTFKNHSFVEAVNNDVMSGKTNRTHTHTLLTFVVSTMGLKTYVTQNKIVEGCHKM